MGESFDVKSKFNIIGVGEVRKKSSIWINKVLWSFVGFKNKLNDQKMKKKFEFFFGGRGNRTNGFLFKPIKHKETEESRR